MASKMKSNIGPAIVTHGKAKRTAVDRFNDNRESEMNRLSAKRKMEHDEKMASIHLKRRKYELRFGSTPLTTSRSDSPGLVMSSGESLEDKQIQILRLQIRLAELTQGTHGGYSGSTSALPSQVQYPHSSDELSTPSSTYTPPVVLSSEAEASNSYVTIDNHPGMGTSDSYASYKGGEIDKLANWDGAFNFEK